MSLEISHNKDSIRDAIIDLVLSARVQHNLAVFWQFTVQQRKRMDKKIILEHCTKE